MKTLSTKKLLILCFTLIFAVVIGLFATLCYRNAYAVVNPDQIAAYDETESGDGDTETGDNTDDNTGSNIPGEDHIAKPQPGGDSGYDPETVKELIVNLGKLKLRVTDWQRPVTPASQAIIDTNPYGEYSPDFVAKIAGLVSDGTFISYSIWDMDGNPIEDSAALASLPAGSTYFIHLDVNEKYKNSIEIEFADGVDRTLAGQIDFPSSEVLERVPRLTVTEFEYAYTGTPVNLYNQFVKGALSGTEDYLMIVESESDANVQNGVGEYHYKVAFKPTAKVCWEGTSNDRSAVDIIVKVTPYVIPTDVDFGEIYYTGLKIDISDKIEEMFGEYVVGQKVSIAATNSGPVGEDVGEYEVKLVITDEYADSIKWQDVEENYIIVKWNILQTTISGEWDTFGNYGIMKLISDTYKGGDAKAIRYIYTDITDGEPGVVVTKLEVGHKYQAKVELLNEDNLKFSDDTELVHIFDFTEEPITLAKPVIEVEEQEFNGTPLSFKVTIDGFDVTTDSELAKYVEIVTEESDALTQTYAGEYTVVIRLKEGVFWTSEEGGYFTNDERLTFTVNSTEIDVTWNEDTGIPTYDSNYTGKDYSSFVICTYYDDLNNEISMADMELNEHYRAVLTFTDLGAENFTWKDVRKTTFDFTLKVAFEMVDVPTFESSFDFTGSAISNYPAGWDDIKDNVTVESGSFVQTNAGEYTVVVKANEGFIWKGEGNDNVVVAGDTVTFKFKINKAVLLIDEWLDNGKVKFTSTYTGNFDNVVDYFYYRKDDTTRSNALKYEDLVEGESYIVVVKLKDSQVDNFDAPELPAEHELESFKPDPKESGIPWWVWLIIAAAVLILILIIIIIIIVLKKRNKDDEYDDYYDDEYYGDEEGEGDDYGDSDGGYDDYGDY